MVPDQEDSLILGREGLLVIEGEERPLRQWDWGAYALDETALRHRAGDTNDAALAYPRFPDLEPTCYREGWPPS
jgi:hypothetical protein